jgi:hypothetical protein
MSQQVVPYISLAEKFALTKTAAILHPKGPRFRFEPYPKELDSALQEAVMLGNLHALEQMLHALENNEYHSKDEFIGDLHLYIMDVNNEMNSRFSVGKKIEGVEHFTNRYVAMPGTPNYRLVENENRLHQLN